MIDPATKQPASSTKAVDDLAAFLAAPPPGTPATVLELLRLIAGRADAPLPPRLYFEAVEQAPVAISITDPSASILYANGAFERLTGYSRDQVLGKNQSILSSKATPETLYRQLWRTITAKRPWHGTLVNRNRAGEDYLAALTIAPVLSSAGEIAYFLGMHQDVTQDHELKIALKQQKRRIETVLDAAPVVVVLTDAAGRVMLDNQEYKKLMSELGGQEPFEVFCEALKTQADIDPLQTLQARKAFKNVELCIERPGSAGPRWFACSGTSASEADASPAGYFVQHDDPESRFLFLANDITARKREVERAHLEHLRARLAEQQMQRGMRDALQAAIFQMQGPMNVIEAALGLLQAGRAEPSTLAGMLGQIRSAGAEALKTLQSALPEESQESGTLVSVNELLRQMLEMETDAMLAAGILVDWQPARLLPRINAQEDQIRALFVHVLNNAIQALVESRAAQRELHVSTRSNGQQVEIEIRDNGGGFDPQLRLKLFEPFFIGWQNRKGRAGMGLAQCQEIVNLHGGCISLEAVSSGGTRVLLSLPVPNSRGDA